MNPLADPVTIVVFEKRPRWTPELQRQFIDEAVHVRGCHAESDILPLATGPRVACVVLSLEGAEADCLQALGRLAIQGADVSVVTLAGERAGGLEWPFRELGAASFLAGVYTPEDVAHVCRRHVAPLGNHDLQ